MPITAGETIIEVKGISFAYGTNSVLKDVSLEIHRGDYLGIIGPNGGGKTTLVRLILGLLEPDEGMIRLFGNELRKFHDWYKIGYVSQKATNIDPKFPATAGEIVAMGRFSRAGLLRRTGQEDRKIISQALEQAGLTELKNKLIGDLSGGQQQRVVIARALAQQPEIIFLDEPTSGVDPASQEQFYSLLKKLNREMGITLVMISHDVDVVSEEVGEVACINQSLVYHGLARKLTKPKLEKLYHKGMKIITHRH